MPSNTVYVWGVGYEASQTYDIYVVEDKAWRDGDCIPQRVARTLESIQTNLDGELLVSVDGVWEAQAVWSPPLTPGKYDITIDVNGNGIYDRCIDILCDNNIYVSAGFLVIPEAPLGTISILLACLLALLVKKSKFAFLHSKSVAGLNSPKHFHFL